MSNRPQQFAQLTIVLLATHYAAVLTAAQTPFQVPPSTLQTGPAQGQGYSGYGYGPNVPSTQSAYQYPATSPPNSVYGQVIPGGAIPGGAIPGGAIPGGATPYGFTPGIGAGSVTGYQPQPPIGPQSFYPPTGPQAGNFAQPTPQGPVILPPPEIANIDIYQPQGPTGRFSAGGTYSTDNGLVGQFILDERDFDIRRFPRTLGEAFSPQAFRGGGQAFRLEVVPGQDLQRYLVSISNPYFRGTENSLSVSGYYFDRNYEDWDEQRVGGRVNFGRRLTNYLSVKAGVRMESVTLDNPRVGTSPQLNADLGNSNLFLGTVGLEYDSRINPYDSRPEPYLTADGSFLGLTFSQAFGDYDYSRGDIEFRHHRMIYARPDGSGRHTLGYRTNLGFSGSSTPVFENYLAGGISSMRGFDFRGVSPIDGGARVGGEFQWLNSLEYQFPLSSDDMINGVMFVDFGTVEDSIQLNSENFRVAPGVGLRVHVPYAGLGAPLSFDFAFPVSTATGDDERTFSFFIGVMR